MGTKEIYREKFIKTYLKVLAHANFLSNLIIDSIASHDTTTLVAAT